LLEERERETERERERSGNVGGFDKKRVSVSVFYKSFFSFHAFLHYYFFFRISKMKILRKKGLKKPKKIFLRTTRPVLLPD